MNSKAEFFRLAGSTVVIEYKDKSIITSKGYVIIKAHNEQSIQ